MKTATKKKSNQGIKTVKKFLALIENISRGEEATPLDASKELSCYGNLPVKKEGEMNGN